MRLSNKFCITRQVMPALIEVDPQMNSGEVTERPKVHAWKACVRK